MPTDHALSIYADLRAELASGEPLIARRVAAAEMNEQPEQTEQVETVDVVVIGAGFVGLAAGAALAAAPASHGKVRILESGTLTMCRFV